MAAKLSRWALLIGLQLAVVAYGQVPVLCVHGVDQRVQSMRPLQEVLQGSGFLQIDVVDFHPIHGDASIPEIALAIQKAALALKARTGAKQIDLVGFSMGALASRYFIQRLGGKDFVRKFISISGPQHGTLAAYLRFFQPGMRDMIPGSDVLLDLQRDKHPFGKIQTYVFYTPYDLIVVPSENAWIEGAVTKSFPVALHHLMIKNKSVLHATAQALEEPYVSPRSTS